MPELPIRKQDKRYMGLRIHLISQNQSAVPRRGSVRGMEKKEEAKMKKTKEQIAEALRHCVNAKDAWACKTCVYYTAEEPEEGPEISCCDRLLLDAAEALEA